MDVERKGGVSLVEDGLAYALETVAVVVRMAASSRVQVEPFVESDGEWMPAEDGVFADPAWIELRSHDATLELVAWSTPPNAPVSRALRVRLPGGSAAALQELIDDVAAVSRLATHIGPTFDQLEGRWLHSQAESVLARVRLAGMAPGDAADAVVAEWSPAMRSLYGSLFRSRILAVAARQAWAKDDHAA